MSAHERRGALLALACYMSWGVFPIYFRLLAPVPTIDILANRMVWSLGLVVLILAIRRDWSWVGPALRSWESMLTFGGAALLLTANWFTYIWAVNAGYVIESSLGYFINPLVSVLLAVFFLHERPRSGQWIAIGIAAAGVLFLTISYGQLPWIALVLALTFGFYGLLKKRARLDALHGLALETAFMFLPALALLFFRETQGAGGIGHFGAGMDLLLVSTGVATVVPLFWFASAARRIPLSLLGILQYVAPTLQFMVGLFVFHEPFSQTKLLGFTVIWMALLWFWGEGMLHRQRGIRATHAPVPDASCAES